MCTAERARGVAPDAVSVPPSAAVTAAAVLWG
jgi:hypothetical protein